jgi:hypothetical protein
LAFLWCLPFRFADKRFLFLFLCMVVPCPSHIHVIILVK